MRGKLIALEGIDGSGKSTQQKKLSEKLTQKGFKVYTTCEPTDSPIGQMIRDIFRGKIESNHQTIAALFLADRLDHIQNKNTGMIKMLDDGYIIICDRYYFSSYAYHSVHMPLKWVIELNEICANLLQPDLNVFIDVDPEISAQRLQSSRDQIELYESLSNLKKVRGKYLEAFDLMKEKEKIAFVDGTNSVEEITDEIWQSVSQIVGGIS